MVAIGMPVVKRHSFLKRHPALTRAGFSQHYEHVHGPLAAAQPGFRRFTYRYTQDHVERSFSANTEAPFDGITMTFQVPRPNYRQGFFQHPDYSNVRPDEERLFDLSATVSLLGEESILFQAASAVGGTKAIILVTGDACTPGRSDLTDIATSHGIQVCIRNDLDRDSVSALGVGAASFPYVQLWEVWFGNPDARQLACGDRRFMETLCGPGVTVQVIFGVREVVIFSEPCSDHEEVAVP